MMKLLAPPAAALALVCAAAAQTPAATILAECERAADWQLAHPAKGSTTDWIEGAFYSGLAALDQAAPDRRYRDALLAIGRRNDWRLGPRLYHADDLCVGQAYLYLYEHYRDPAMIAPLRRRCDTLLAHPPSDNLAFVGRDKNNRWSWSDSLFMAPPTWVELAKATGDARYRQYAVAHWWQTSAYLFDPQEHLFFRDSTYFKRREANGQKVFWSRGNGWVLAGLAHVLDALPADDPSRPRFDAQFRELASRIAELQLPNGMWAASLLDPKDCRPEREVSGTGFFCFGFAWGVNHGLLDRSRFAPAAWRAWRGLEGCMEPDGRLNHVQPVGAAPSNFPADSTVPYGVGAVLLAGTEMMHLQ